MMRQEHRTWANIDFNYTDDFIEPKAVQNAQNLHFLSQIKYANDFLSQIELLRIDNNLKKCFRDAKKNPAIHSFIVSIVNFSNAEMNQVNFIRDYIFNLLFKFTPNKDQEIDNFFINCFKFTKNHPHLHDYFIDCVFPFIFNMFIFQEFQGAAMYFLQTAFKMHETNTEFDEEITRFLMECSFSFIRHSQAFSDTFITNVNYRLPCDGNDQISWDQIIIDSVQKSIFRLTSHELQLFSTMRKKKCFSKMFIDFLKDLSYLLDQLPLILIKKQELMSKDPFFWNFLNIKKKIEELFIPNSSPIKSPSFYQIYTLDDQKYYISKLATSILYHIFENNTFNTFNCIDFTQAFFISSNSFPMKHLTYSGAIKTLILFQYTNEKSLFDPKYQNVESSDDNYLFFNNYHFNCLKINPFDQIPFKKDEMKEANESYLRNYLLSDKENLKSLFKTALRNKKSFESNKSIKEIADLEKYAMSLYIINILSQNPKKFFESIFLSLREGDSSSILNQEINELQEFITGKKIGELINRSNQELKKLRRDWKQNKIQKPLYSDRLYIISNSKNFLIAEAIDKAKFKIEKQVIKERNGNIRDFKNLIDSSQRVCTLATRSYAFLNPLFSYGPTGQFQNCFLNNLNNRLMVEELKRNMDVFSEFLGGKIDLDDMLARIPKMSKCEIFTQMQNALTRLIEGRLIWGKHTVIISTDLDFLLDCNNLLDQNQDCDNILKIKNIAQTYLKKEKDDNIGIFYVLAEEMIRIADALIDSQKANINCFVQFPQFNNSEKIKMLLNLNGFDENMKKKLVEKFISLSRTNIQLPLIKEFRSFYKEKGNSIPT